MSDPDKFESSVLRLTPPALEIRAEARGEIRGLAAVFGGAPDGYGDVIAPGAFAETLAEHAERGTTPPMLWSHDPSRPIGRWDELRETGRGLEVEGRLNLSTEAGRAAFEHLKARDVSGLSIGFRAVEAEAGPRGGRRLTRVDLGEISVVAIPAAPAARVAEVKTLGSRAELRDLLRQAGLAKAAAERIASGGWPALAGPGAEAAEAEAKSIAAEIRRLTQKIQKGNRHA